MSGCAAETTGADEFGNHWEIKSETRDMWSAAEAYDLMLEFGLNFDRSHSGVDELLQLLMSHVEGTSSGADIVVLKPDICRERTGNELLFELKRLSGLSWEQIAKLVGVSRRAVHNWAAGGAISLENNQCLGDLVTTLRFIDCGESDRNRSLLLSPAEEGVTYYDLLKQRAFGRVKALAGKGIGRPVPQASIRESALQASAPKSFAEEMQQLGVIDIAADAEPEIVSKPQYRRGKARRK